MRTSILPFKEPREGSILSLRQNRWRMTIKKLLPNQRVR